MPEQTASSHLKRFLKVVGPGMTVCDFRRLTAGGKAMRGSGPENALVAVDPDARRLIDDVADTPPGCG